ncbi:MAG TPA: zinc ribbon domain-containing protein, partial [Anaerolineales bacterium]
TVPNLKAASKGRRIGTGRRRSLDVSTHGYGANVIVADRWFPSSKMCRICGTLNDELTLKDRVFVRGGCGHTEEEDRDIHAAMNLHNYPGQQGK